MCHRCLARRRRHRSTALKLAGAKRGGIGAGQADRAKHQQAAIEKWRRRNGRHVVLRRRNTERRATDDQPVARRDNHRARGTCRDRAADRQLVHLAGARLVGRNAGERSRDQHGFGRGRDGGVSRINRLGEGIGKILATDGCLLWICGRG